MVNLGFTAISFTLVGAGDDEQLERLAYECSPWSAARVVVTATAGRVAD